MMKFAASALCLLFLVGLAATFPIVTWHSDNPETTYVSVAQILFDWPPLAFGGAAAFVWRFHSNIADVLDRLKSIDTPWGRIDASTQGEVPPGGEPPEPEAVVTSIALPGTPPWDGRGLRTKPAQRAIATRASAAEPSHKKFLFIT